MPRGTHGNHARGHAHYRWNRAKILNREGYVKVRVGLGHPLADPNGYVYEHVIVWCAAGNRKPDIASVLHHRNGDRTDNRIENLELMLRSVHNALHTGWRRRDARGRFLPRAAGRLLDGREWNEYPNGGRP